MKGQAIEWVEQPGSKRGPLTSESVCGRSGAHIYLDDTYMEMGPTQKEILRKRGQSVSFSKENVEESGTHSRETHPHFYYLNLGTKAAWT